MASAQIYEHLSHQTMMMHPDMQQRPTNLSPNNTNNNNNPYPPPKRPMADQGHGGKMVL